MVDALLDALHPSTSTTTVGTKTITAPMRLHLMTANGTDTTAGTELTTSGDYVAGTGGGISIGTKWNPASGKSKSTDATIQQEGMPAATVTGVEIWDTSTPRQRIDHGDMTDKACQANDTLIFTAAAIAVVVT